MNRASVHISPAFRVAPVNPRLFGSFVEHMGRAVYTGIFEPGHPEASEEGFREDVLELVRELGVTAIRYPGGNFVSGYRWEDGVGPVAERPRRLDLAWHSIETNAFGLNEFMAWSERAGTEPMMAVNLGTRGVMEAVDVLEYATTDRGTAGAELRKEHGYEAPHDISLWCLGNEMDGPWQVGHKTGAEYGRLATETAKAMRKVDDTLELVLCGSSGPAMSTFGTWEAEVLEEAFDHVDFISAHAYFEELDHDARSFLASGVEMDRMIDAIAAVTDAIALRRRSTKRIMISFDEWNVWYREPTYAAEGPPRTWTEAPRLIEDTYNVTDAVVVGGLLISLLRHADRVGVACLAQLVNVIAPIRSEPNGPAWRQTTFHPFALTARYARGEVLRLVIESDVHQTKDHGEVAVADAVATWDAETSELTVFAINRSDEDDLELRVDTSAFPELALIEAVQMHDDDRHAVNDAQSPDRVTPRPLTTVAVEDSHLRIDLAAVSWAMIRLRVTSA